MKSNKEPTLALSFWVISHCSSGPVDLALFFCHVVVVIINVAFRDDA